MNLNTNVFHETPPAFYTLYVKKCIPMLDLRSNEYLMMTTLLLHLNQARVLVDVDMMLLLLMVLS